jgi:hypothetical protein
VVGVDGLRHRRCGHLTVGRLDEGQHGARIERAARRCPDVAHDATARRMHRMLHLHRLEHRHLAACRDPLADDEVQRDHRALQGAVSATRPAGASTATAGTAAGPARAPAGRR